MCLYMFIFTLILHSFSLLDGQDIIANVSTADTQPTFEVVSNISTTSIDAVTTVTEQSGSFTGNASTATASTSRAFNYTTPSSATDQPSYNGTTAATGSSGQPSIGLVEQLVAIITNQSATLLQYLNASAATGHDANRTGSSAGSSPRIATSSSTESPVFGDMLSTSVALGNENDDEIYKFVVIGLLSVVVLVVVVSLLHKIFTYVTGQKIEYERV